MPELHAPLERLAQRTLADYRRIEPEALEQLQEQFQVAEAKCVDASIQRGRAAPWVPTKDQRAILVLICALIIYISTMNSEPETLAQDLHDGSIALLAGLIIWGVAQLYRD
jgi:hypothetical protein